MTNPPAPSPIHWSPPERKTAFEAWLTTITPTFGLVASSVTHASADASFRRYFRVLNEQGRSMIIMDAPPDKEDCAPFVHVQSLMQAAGLHVPEVLNWCREHGFLLLSDIGQLTMMQGMSTTKPQLHRYVQAIDILVTWQLASQPGKLPPYDRALLMRELQLFPDWFVTSHLQKTLTPDDHTLLQRTFDVIVTDNLSSANAYVHRDFMPRNLMLPNNPDGDPAHALGVLDFQDAVFGPITYDIASLTRDAFVSWDESFVLDVTIRYWEKAKAAGLPVHGDFGAFFRAVEWMGLQRHLKILGIFARLTLRDGKPQYLADTPRFLDYVRHTCNRYQELRPFGRWLNQLTGYQEPQGFAFGRV